MSLSCFVVDDHGNAAEHLAGYIKRAGLELIGLETDAVNAMQAISAMPIKPDVTFLDISMPGISGLEMARALKGQTRIVFTTAHRSYAPESYKLDAVYYLLKPITYDDFLGAVNKIMATMATEKDQLKPTKEFITIQGSGKGGIIRIKADEIIYLKSAEHYVEIHAVNKQYLVHRSMKALLTELGAYPFVRVHKSYAVNVQQVVELKDNTIHLSDGSKVVLSSNYRIDFLKYL